MKTTKLYITTLAIMLWSFSFAQQYTNYTTKDGLPSNHIYRITQDNNGFIWFITDKGMVKFNGKTFKTFTTKNGLPSNDIWDIRITADNKIWYFTKATKLGYIKNDSVYAFPNNNENNIVFPTVISQNKNDIIFLDKDLSYQLKNKVWVTSSKKDNSLLGEGRVIHNKIKSILYNFNSDSIFIIDKRNRKLKGITLPKNLLYNYRGQINDSLYCWIRPDSISFLNLNQLQLYTSPLAKSSKRFTRFSTANGSIQFSGENFIAFLDSNYQLTNFINIPTKFQSHYSFKDKNNNLWIATFNNGVYFLPEVRQKAKYQLQNEKVGKIQKVNNSLIANIYKKGFYKYNTKNQRFEAFINDDGFIYSAHYFKELNAYFYLSDTKTIRIKNNKIQTFENFEIARDLVYFNNSLYGNTSFGLNKINPVNYKVITNYQQTGIRDLIIHNNRLLLATSNGVKYLEKDAILPLQFNKIKFDKPIISFAKLDDNNLLINTDGFGSYITDFNKINILEHSEFLDVTCSYIFNNNVYLATNKGVWWYERINDKYLLQKKYTRNDGLNSNKINAVKIHDNNLITSSNNGISIIPLSFKKTNQFIDIYFDKVFYDGKLIPYKSQVQYTQNNQLQAQIATIDFSELSTLTYSYQLTPIQKKWTKSTANSLVFSDLQPNNYELKIQIGEIQKIYPFKITPLWWQRTISKIGMRFAILFTLLNILLLYRKKELKKKTSKINAEKKLAEFELHALRSHMNPHFVFNSLNAIQYYLNDNKLALSEKYLVKFSKLIRMFFDFSQKKEISIAEEIKLLTGYLEIEKLRFGDDFIYEIIVDTKLNTEQEIPAMLLQPIVENAVNHGLFHKKGKGKITINFTQLAPDTYNVTIKDTGIGRQKSQEIKKNSITKHHSKSTQILKERIELLNKSSLWNISYQISDLNKQNNTGTIVSLTLTKL